MLTQVTHRWKEVYEDGLFYARALDYTLNDIPVKLIVGFYPVIYGCRVRAGILEEGYPHIEIYKLDYCGGMNEAALTLIYNRVCERITFNVDSGKYPFEGFIRQQRKPIQNDPDTWPELMGNNSYRTHFTFDHLDNQVKIHRTL